jgi:hypothetical protein
MVIHEANFGTTARHTESSYIECPVIHIDVPKGDK